MKHINKAVFLLLFCAFGANAMIYTNVNDGMHTLTKGQVFEATMQPEKQDITNRVTCKMCCIIDAACMKNTDDKYNELITWSYYKNGKMLYLRQQKAGTGIYLPDTFSWKKSTNAVFKMRVDEESDDCMSRVLCRSICQNNPIPPPFIPLILPPKSK